MSKTIVEERKRGWFGMLLKIVFYLFNAFMTLWFVLWIVGLFNMPECVGEFASACRAGQLTGSFAAFTMLSFIWLTGEAIIVLMLLATRGQKVVREINTDT